MGTFFVGLAVLGLIGLVLRVMINDKKAGKNCCGVKCSGCPSSGMCHSKNK